jgi:hypothetical protein
MSENRPTIYRWVNERKGLTSPGGTKEFFFFANAAELDLFIPYFSDEIFI